MTRKLDMANGLAFLFLFFTYGSWELIVHKIVRGGWGVASLEDTIVLIPATILLLADSILFGCGVYANGSSESPFPAFLVTLAYASILLLFSYFVIKIERRAS